MKPDAVKFATELPKTRNAKIMRRLIRATYMSSLPAPGPVGKAAGAGSQPMTALGDVSALENPRSLDAVRDAR
jgi:acetyl-CoA synthetase